MPEIPHDRSPESSLALLTDPYGFIAKRCRRLDSDVFRTRLLLETNICLMGRDAAEMFYDDERFTRKHAVLKRIERTLTGVGGVQGLDGAAHRHRKQLYISLVTPEAAVRLAEISNGHWRAAAARWKLQDSVRVYDQAREVICRSVCEWAGVPVAESEIPKLARELASMYEEAASLGPKYFKAWFNRRRRNRWAARLVEDVRNGRTKTPDGSPLAVIAGFRDFDGRLLTSQVAAIELQNILRPTIAVSVFITFAALALHQHSELRERIAAGANEYAEMFAQEVRRFFPFFPAVAARARSDFEWRGYCFPKGTRVILGLYATNRDPRFWNAPQDFNPERFRDWNNDPYAFIPQGGGDRERHHRCPGDRVSVELTKTATQFLCNEITYEVPPQNLELPMTQLPPLPRSHFILRNVRERS